MSIENDIKRRWENRADRYTTIVQNSLPNPRRINEPSFFFGHYSLTCPRSRTRIMVRTDAVKLGRQWEAPTTGARDYIAVVWGKAPRMLKKSRIKIEEALGRPHPAPLYAKPCSFVDGYYVDIRRAYYSILLVAGWDMRYSPGDYLAFGRPPNDFPFVENRVARHTLVSACRWEGVPEYQAMFPSVRSEHPNHLYHPQCTLLIRDVLTGLAADAVRAGAVYVATDGYIAPNQTTADCIQSVIADWGLECRIKANGPGRVFSQRSYRVGELVTVTQRAREETFSGIADLDYRRWLRARFSAIAAGRLEA